MRIRPTRAQWREIRGGVTTALMHQDAMLLAMRTPKALPGVIQTVTEQLEVINKHESELFNRAYVAVFERDNRRMTTPGTGKARTAKADGSSRLLGIPTRTHYSAMRKGFH